MANEVSTTLSPIQANHVLAGLVYEQVRACVNFGELAAIEERIAIELARLPETTDEQMLELAHATVARALQAVADRHRRGEAPDEQALSTRYMNAICRAVDPSLDPSSAVAE